MPLVPRRPTGGSLLLPRHLLLGDLSLRKLLLLSLLLLVLSVDVTTLRPSCANRHVVSDPVQLLLLALKGNPQEARPIHCKGQTYPAAGWHRSSSQLPGVGIRHGRTAAVERTFAGEQPSGIPAEDVRRPSEACRGSACHRSRRASQNRPPLRRLGEGSRLEDRCRRPCRREWCDRRT